jgi:hypothetical protein
MTYDGAAIRIYVDGRLDGTMAASGPININASPVRIGGIGPGSPYNFNGLIDEVSFYNRALTPEEIRGLYLSGAAGKCTP